MGGPDGFSPQIDAAHPLLPSLLELLSIAVREFLDPSTRSSLEQGRTPPRLSLLSSPVYSSFSCLLAPRQAPGLTRSLPWKAKKRQKLLLGNGDPTSSKLCLTHRSLLSLILTFTRSSTLPSLPLFRPSCSLSLNLFRLVLVETLTKSTLSATQRTIFECTTRRLAFPLDLTCLRGTYLARRPIGLNPRLSHISSRPPPVFGAL